MVKFKLPFQTSRGTGWTLKCLRRWPNEKGGLKVGELVKVVAINKSKKEITVIPGSPPLKKAPDVFN